MTFALTWLIGFSAAATALSICRAEARQSGFGGVSFDKPLRRALSFGLAIASLALLAFYAMLGDGVLIPLAVLLVFGGTATAAARFRPAALARAGGMAFPLALVSFVCVIAAFQQVYGDFFFGFDDPFGK